VALIAGLAGLGACKSGQSKQAVGLMNVDDLLSSIERVHVETELARESAAQTLSSLQWVVESTTAGDPLTAFAEFGSALERSEIIAESLAESIEPMKRASEPVFEQWAQDLAGFKSAKMRHRSLTRLTETRERYDAIVAAVEPAEKGYKALNLGMRDIALFLGNDFNEASVQLIEGDVSTLSKVGVMLDERFADALGAARAYIEDAALPVRVDMTPSMEGATREFAVDQGDPFADDGDPRRR
jgi:hypothetical protein